MCMADDAEGCSFWQDQFQRARKEHKCNECGRIIQRGEVYKRCIWVGDGQFGHSKMCPHCSVCAEWLRDNCGGFLTYAIYEDIQQHVEEYAYLGWRYLAGLGRLQVGMRRDWRIQYGPRLGQLMPIPNLPPTIDERTAQPA